MRAGQLIHTGNLILVQRLQAGGPSSLNLSAKTISELGNYQSVATTRDIPDLSFPLSSFDATDALEALLLNVVDDGTQSPYLIENCVPMDVASQVLAGRTAPSPYAVVSSVGIPTLYLEQLQYAFDVTAEGKQTATLRGDSIFHCNGTTYVQQAAGTAAANQIVALTNPALPYNGDAVAGTRYALAVAVDGQRKLFGTDYTEQVTGAGQAKTVTVTMLAAVPTTSTIRIMYQSTTAGSYPQSVHDAVSVRPAAVRGKDIKVFLNPQVGGVVQPFASGVLVKGVQKVQVDWKATLDRDTEFGNPALVGQDFDVPAVTASIDIKPVGGVDMYEHIRALTGTVDGEVVGAQTYQTVSLDMVVHHPDTGAALKTVHVPDLTFQLPTYNGQVGQKLTMTTQGQSNAGLLRVYRGTRP